MKIKIGDTLYDAKNEPILLIIEPYDMQYMKEKFITKQPNIFIFAPPSMDPSEVEEFLQTRPANVLPEFDPSNPESNDND